MMLTIKSAIVPYSFSSLCTTNHRRFLLATLNHMHRSYPFLGNQSPKIFKTSLEFQHATNKKGMAVYNGVDPGPVLPSDPSSPGSWKMWIVGMLITVILPFWRNKWWPLLTLKDRVESVVEKAEHVTDIVEKVAEEVEKVAEEVADHLPDGRLKEAVTFVENVAKETAKDAHLVHEVIDKVEEVEKDAESLIETVFDHNDEIVKDAKDQN